MSAAERPRRLALSSLIARDLRLMGTREQHRRQMLTMLLLAHVLLTLAVAIGYVFPRPTSTTLAVVGLVLLVYAGVAVANLLLRHLALAIAFLVFGDAIIVTALVGAMALTGQPYGVAQVALLSLAVIGEAGLLFTPEIVLILSGATCAFTAVALLFAISLAPPPTSGQTYLLVVFPLTLQALVGLLAWYTADFIAEAIQEVRRASQQEYAQTRLDALLAQSQRQQRDLDLGIVAIQTAIGKALAQEPQVRIDRETGRLTDLARSVNLLLQRLDEAGRLAQEQARMLAATGSVAEMVGRLGGGTGTTGANLRAPMTYTPMDNISIVASQVQAQQHARQAHIQRLTSEAAHIAGRSRDELKVALDATSDAQALVGRLLTAAEHLVLAMRRHLDASARSRQTLVGHIPPDVRGTEPTRPPTSVDVSEAVVLSGLDADIFRPGETGEFPLAPDEDPAEAHMGKLTRLMPTLPPAEPTLPPEEAMVEVWRLLGELDATATSDERAALSLSHELGRLNREMRESATKLAWVLQALETLRRNAEQIEHVATTADPLPHPPSTVPPIEAITARPPARSRPLASDLPAEPSATMEGSPAEPGTLNAADLLGPLGDEPVPGDDGTGPEAS